MDDKRRGLDPSQSLRPVPGGDDRAQLATALATAGLRDVEAASFVSPKAVPSMADAGAVVSELATTDGVTWWALVPNARGVELAWPADLDLEEGDPHVHAR